MSSDGEWALLERLFQEGLDLSPEERAQLLGKNLADRPDLQKELCGLWDVDQREDPFQSIRFIIHDCLKSLPAEHPSPSDFSQLEILELIGRGGMGVVYKARQKQINRLVALKVLPLGNCTDERILRFRGEQKALALIDHPNVARVYDCGETPEGQPFYTMDYLEGATITNWCDQHLLPIAERLRLIRGVCEGLAQAHLRGIIHRDINPNNILVTQGADGPVARVIDFGIAKFRDQPTQTLTGATLGTPGYMSPEQARGGEEAEVDVRSDIFNLGLLIYELCTGTSPWKDKFREASDPGDILRTVGEYPPMHPREAIRVQGEELTEIARRRAVNPKALEKMVEGELGWIIMKALSLKPELRYQDCPALIRDLDNYQQGLPLDAAPTNRFYRIRKLAWYHRRPLYLGGAFLGVLFAAVIGVLIAFFQVSRAELETRETLDQLMAVQDFTVGIFQEVDPARSGRLVTGFDLLDRAERHLSAKYGKRPELEAPMRMVLGHAWRKLGFLERANVQFEQAIELYRSALGDAAEETLLALEAAAFTAADVGDLQLAHERFAACRKGFSVLFGPDSPKALSATGGMALVLGELGFLDQALTLFRQTLSAQEAVLGVDNYQTRATRHNLANLLISTGKLAEAAELQKVIMEQALDLYEEDLPYVLKARHNQCFLLEKQRRQGEASTCYEALLAERERVLGRFHPDSLLTRNNLATTIGDAGRETEALKLLRSVLDDPERPGSRHPIYLRLNHNLGHFLMVSGRWQEARPILEETLFERGRILGPTHPSTLRTEWTLAETWLSSGERMKALARFQKIAAKAEAALGLEHADTQLYNRLLTSLQAESL